MTKTASAAVALQVPQGLSLPEKIIQHIEVTDAALQKAAAFEKTAAATKSQVDALIPTVVDTMVQFQRINPDQREKLAELLRDPVQVLGLLIKTAGHRNIDEIGQLGQRVPAGQTKTAGAATRDPASSLTNPNVGARTTMVKQSDLKLLHGLGIRTPQV